MSFFGKYDPREKILQRINNSEGFDGDNVLSFMKEVRDLIELRKFKDRYTLLNLYCNWCLHPLLSDSNTIYKILEDISEIFNSGGSESITEVNKILSMEEMRMQMINLFASENIPDYWVSIPDNWHGFRQRLLTNVIQKPIQFPSSIIEEAEKFEMGLNIPNRYKKAVQIYCRVKNKTAGLMATKLILSDRVEGKRQGDVYWIVEITKQRYIMGRLSFYDPR